MHYTREQIDEAKTMNLYDFLIENHEDEFKKERHSIRLLDNKSISIRDDFTGFYDFSTNEGGDNIKFLTDYLGYTFEGAVAALLSGEGETDRIITQNTKPKAEPGVPKKIFLPPKAEGFPRQVYAYLTKTRGIPKVTVERMMNKGYIYQTDNHSNNSVFHNAVFVNGKKDCYEVRGTLTYGERYMNNDFTLKDRFWYFGNGTKVYLTEGAIDAISLYELLDHEPAIYASMRGVNNEQIIQRILRHEEFDLILAVDNDIAGENLRKKYPDVPVIVPTGKDWNEDWIHRTKMNMTAEGAEIEERRRHERE